MSTVEDYFEKLPVVEGQPSHLRLDGELSGGYFCKICGGPLMNGQDGEHGLLTCPDDQDLVGAIREKNFPSAP